MSGWRPALRLEMPKMKGTASQSNLPSYPLFILSASTRSVPGDEASLIAEGWLPCGSKLNAPNDFDFSILTHMDRETIVPFSLGSEERMVF